MAAEDTIASGVRDQIKPSKDEPQLETSGNGQTELMDVDDDGKALNAAQQITPRPSQAQTPVPTQPTGFSFDVCFEASKLPLDIAIYNSTRATGGEEKIRKYLQAVLVVGGTALTQGIVHALESRYRVFPSSVSIIHHIFRLQAIAAPLVPSMEKVQIIPPPKEVDRRVLVWKGAAVLGKMDSVSELWVTRSDWVSNIFCSSQSVAHGIAGFFGHTRPQGTMLLPVINFKIYMNTVCTVRMASNVVTRKTG